MSWGSTIWLAALLCVVAFVTFTHTELLCQNRRGETTFAGRGYGHQWDADWIYANGRLRRLVSGESCIQRRVTGR